MYYVVPEEDLEDFTWSYKEFSIKPIETQDEWVLPATVVKTPGIPENLKSAIQDLSTKSDCNWIVREE